MSAASRSAQRGAMGYVQAAGSEPWQVLDEIEELLQALGTSKSRLLTARVLPSDKDVLTPAERRIDITVTATN